MSQPTHNAEILHGSDLADAAFGSDVNLAGAGLGGGIQGKYPENEELPLGKRVSNNCSLCFWSTLAGMGMFTEAYYILGFGNIKDIWKVTPAFADCYKDTPESDCNQGLIKSLSYINYAAMMLGMITFGYFADKYGRRWGSTTNVSILLVGAILGTAAYSGAINGLITMFVVGMIIVGYAVGAEYPLAATSAAERAEKLKATQPHIRGKGIAFTFAMQGIGNLVADIMLIILLAAYGCTQKAKTDFTAQCDGDSLNAIWRWIYGLGLIPIVCLIFGRFKYLKESEQWENVQEGKSEDASKVDPEDKECDAGKTNHHLSKGAKLGFLFKHYWHRLVGTALGWLVWDFAYYGAKGYNGTIVAAVIGNELGNGAAPSLWVKMEYTLYAQIIQCFGYYLAALVVDKSWMGRMRLQTLGFAMMCILMFISFFMYDTLTKPENVGAFAALYFLSGFFQQFGPNTTTWLLPAEIYPTELRALGHGISAGTGKFGAILSGIIFAYGNHGEKITAKTIFLLSGIIGIIGVVLTVILIPDVTTLDLTEQDKRWNYILNGKEEEYHGEACNPKYLSLYERMTGKSKHYRKNAAN